MLQLRRTAQKPGREEYPRPRSGVVAETSYPTPEVRAVAERSNPTSKKQWLCGRRRA